MSITKKFLLLYISIITPIIVLIAVFSLKTENFLFTYLIAALIFLLLAKFVLKIDRKLWMYLYKKYINILDEELDPEKFIELTEIEYKKNKSRKYRNYMKLNLCAGYSSAGKIQTGYEKLKEVDLSGKSFYREQDKILYYYNEALLLNVLGKKEEAVKIYNENILEEKKRFENSPNFSEMNNNICVLEAILFYENDNDKIIEILLEALKKVKTKRQNISIKYQLAECKEKIGKIDEAEELYREVAEKGNKLFIVEEAKKKLEEISSI